MASTIQRSFKRTLIAALALPLLIALAGCSSLQDAVTDGAKQVASSAAAVAKEKVTAEVTKQICAPVLDGTITAEDQQTISGMISLAKQSGLADDLIASLEKVTEGTGVSPTDLSTLTALCEKTPAQ